MRIRKLSKEEGGEGGTGRGGDTSGRGEKPRRDESGRVGLGSSRRIGNWSRERGLR